MMKNKKGVAIIELIGVLGIIFAIVLTILIVKVIANNIDSTGAFSGTPEAQSKIDQFQDVGYPAMNNMFMILFFGVHLVLIIIAFQTRTHPAFFIISAFIAVPILVFIAAIISNAYEVVQANPTMAAADTSSAVITNILSNLPIYEFAMSIMILIVLYGINKSEGA